MTILITGGTGFIGQKLARHFIDAGAERIIIYSRSESKQAEMRKAFDSDILRFWVGDVRDSKRMCEAMQNVNYCIHAAALKRVEVCEYNPDEAIKTNVEGTKSVIDACLQSPNIVKAVFISTDKGVEPLNIYGTTKALAEKLWIAMCVKKPVFAAVRYGNVIGSTGSVIPYFKGLKATGAKELPVTVPNMSRFMMFPEDAKNLIELAMYGMPQKIYVAKAKAFSMIRLCRAFGLPFVEIGIRPGEKYHETLISKHESFRTHVVGEHFEIAPEMPYDDDLVFCDGPLVQPYTEYNSYDAEWYEVDELKEII